MKCCSQRRPNLSTQNDGLSRSEFRILKQARLTNVDTIFLYVNAMTQRVLMFAVLEDFQALGCLVCFNVERKLTHLQLNWIHETLTNIQIYSHAHEAKSFLLFLVLYTLCFFSIIIHHEVFVVSGEGNLRWQVDRSVKKFDCFITRDNFMVSSTAVVASAGWLRFVCWLIKRTSSSIDHQLQQQQRNIWQNACAGWTLDELPQMFCLSYHAQRRSNDFRYRVMLLL